MTSLALLMMMRLTARDGDYNLLSETIAYLYLTSIVFSLCEDAANFYKVKA